MSFDSEVLSEPDLLAYWKLAESSTATPAADASGNGRTGAYTNTPTLGAASLIPGDASTAMQTASNSGQCMSVADAAWMDVNGITVEAIVSLSSGTDGSNGDALVSRYTSGGFNWLLWRNTAGHFAFQCRNAGGTAYNVSAGGPTSLPWVYLAATFDPVNNLSRFFVAGIQTQQVATSGNLQGGSSPIEVGRYSGAAATTPGMVIQRVAIHGAALSPARIAAHQAALPISGVWGWVG